MKSDVIHITGDGNGIEAALSQAEGVAAFKKLDKKDAIHLRLFTEELMGMVQNLTGELESDFWIEAEGNDYQLHLLTQTAMNAAKREKLLSVSTSGKNDVKGFMAKVKSAFESAVHTMESGYSDAVSLGIVESVGSVTFNEWTLSNYKAQMKEDEWDELERSIVASLADEVKVRINGSKVELIIEKTF